MKVYGGSFLALAAGQWIAEQMHPRWAQNEAEFLAASDDARPIVSIEGDVALIARYGAGTWGHWLGELLPKAALLEAAYPRRFRYAVPDSLLSASANTKWQVYRDSLACYGIEADRLIGVRNDSNYVFKALHYVTSVWMDFAFHPGAIEIMRAPCGTAPVDSDGPSRIALLRRDISTRNLSNLSEIETLLNERGFVLRDPGNMPFRDQIALFSSAPVVVGVLGSGLAGLIYAPDEVTVLSLAPKNFGDRFFYAMIQARQGRYADIRGPVVEPHPSISHWSSFRIDPAELATALDALSA